jgi:putative tryptophan/tyrosine transport system substrate-binding protein
MGGLAGLSARGLALTLVSGCDRLPFPPLPIGKPRRIGHVSSGPRQPELEDALRQGFRELGYVEGRDTIIEWRYAEEREDRLPEIVAGLVRLPVDVLITVSSSATLVARQHTAAIPIVFVQVSDPVGLGLVVSLAHPGGNATGLSTLSGAISGKRMELLKESVPGLARVAVLWNAVNPGMAVAFSESKEAAQRLGLAVQSLGARNGDEVDSLLESAQTEHIESIVVLPAIARPPATQVQAFASRHHVPVMYSDRTPVDLGGLMGLGPNYAQMRRRAAAYVDKILKGANPGDIAVEQPTTFDFVVNRTALANLQLTLPPEVAAQVTEWVS